MTSVVVVTKRAGFTLTLHSPDHHFSELRPTTGWLRRSWSEDVVVLDLETAGATREAIVDLRTSGHRQPVVVVANDSDGWDGLLADHPDVHLISLPIAPKSLLSTVNRAARAAGTPSQPEHLPQLASVAVSDTEHLATGTDALGAETLPAPRTSEAATLAEPTVAAPLAPPTAPAPTVGAPPEPPNAPPAPVTPAAPAAVRAAPPMMDNQPIQPARGPAAIDLVRDLIPLVGRLSRLFEVAEMTRVRCCSVVQCDASAVLVPDGEVWRVAASDRLRPLEERVQVAATHWLVTEVVGKGHGLLFEDTDVARTKLSGAPLASWPNLLAMPIPDVDAVVLLARREKPFRRADLTAARQSLGAAPHQLREAVDIRHLARSLSQFTDPVG